MKTSIINGSEVSRLSVAIQMRDLILQLSKSSIYSTKPFGSITFQMND